MMNPKKSKSLITVSTFEMVIIVMFEKVFCRFGDNVASIAIQFSMIQLTLHFPYRQKPTRYKKKKRN